MAEKNTVSYYTDKELSKHNIRHAFFTRGAGMSQHSKIMQPSQDKALSVVKNRTRMLGAIGLSKTRQVFVQLENNSNVSVLKSITGSMTLYGCDALVCNKPGMALSLSVADCIPIFLYDPMAQAIGIVHSGWRPAAGKILSKTIRAMQSNFGTNPAHLLAVLGPGICGACYEIKNDVAGLFATRYKIKRGNKLYLDLRAANMGQLQANKVRNIENISICTYENPHLFFSARLEGNNTGRCLATISL